MSPSNIVVRRPTRSVSTPATGDARHEPKPHAPAIQPAVALETPRSWVRCSARNTPTKLIARFTSVPQNRTQNTGDSDGRGACAEFMARRDRSKGPGLPHGARQGKARTACGRCAIQPELDFAPVAALATRRLTRPRGVCLSRRASAAATSDPELNLAGGREYPNVGTSVLDVGTLVIARTGRRR